MHRLHTALYTALLLASLPVSAADRSDFEKWMQQEQSSFKEYRDKRDQEFTRFLKSQWKEMQTFQGVVRDEKPKPKVMPVAPIVTAPVPVQPPVVTLPAPAPSKVPAPVTPGTAVPQLPVPPATPVPPTAAIPVPDKAPVIPIVTVPPIAAIPEPVKVAPVAVPALPKGQKLD
ncbi:MAG: hypothetical protein HYZ31_04910, partial [Gammaproteobacteria bacterium]|nr:hypothetical protein [Gammaproteobacteria bacterium]